MTMEAAGDLWLLPRLLLELHTRLSGVLAIFARVERCERAARVGDLWGLGPLCACCASVSTVGVTSDTVALYVLEIHVDLASGTLGLRPGR